MDPLTQGALGAAAAQSLDPRGKASWTSLGVGVLAGMAPDLDSLIRSSEDPLLYFEYHRQFTHSLIFIPLGALIVSLLCWIWLCRRDDYKFSEIYWIALIAYATHGLLDACTNYGTQLLWPFSNTRVAWDIISIIDPIFTLFLMGGLLLSVLIKNNIAYARFGLGLALLYLSFTAFQHEAVIEMARQKAIDRGHKAERTMAKPSIFNSILWRTLYEHDGKLYVDALRILPFTEPKWYEGAQAEFVSFPEDFSDLSPDTQLAKDILRFQWFSKDWLIWHPEIPDVLGDARYSLIPNEFDPLWGIVVDRDLPSEHVRMAFSREVDDGSKDRFFKMLKGEEID